MQNNNDTNPESDLLIAYSRYVAYVRKLEEIVYHYSKADLMSLDFLREYGVEINQIKTHTFPWNINLTNDNEKQLFEQISVVDYDEYNLPYAFVGVDYTFEDKKDRKSFISLPSVLQSHSDVVLLPDLYEHFIVAYKNDAKLKDTSFIIDGQYKVDYNWDCGDIKLQDAVSSIEFLEKLKTVIALTASLDKYKETFDYKAFSIISEGLASRYVKPLETVILNSLARVSEISRSVLQNKFSVKTFKDAEKHNLITSAARFDDYINIRHLLHHQFDGLSGFGYFSYGKQTSLTDKRWRYLQSYAKICGGKMFDRVKAYIDSIDDFRPLVQRLYPNLLSRNKNESNSKFITRIKDYKNQNSNDRLIIELNYWSKDSNNLKLMKTVNKLFPEANIIDAPNTGFDTLSKELDDYALLTSFLKNTNDLEGYMSFACLSYGQNLLAKKATKFLEEKNVIDRKTSEKLQKYRIMRNKLSHELFTAKQAENLKSSLDDFLQTYTLVVDNIEKNIPEGVQTEVGIFRFTHGDGLVVDIDFDNRKILSIKDKDGNNLKPKIEEKERRLNPYFSDGTYIDYKKQQVIFYDNSILNFKSDNLYCLTINNPHSRQTANILMDKKFKVKKYILNGREISVSKGDIRSDVSSYIIRFDKNKHLEKIIHKTSDNERKSLNFCDGNNSYIVLTDGKKIDCSTGTPDVMVNYKHMRQGKER